VPRAFAFILCGVGAMMLLGALRQSTRGRETRSWTRTGGRIVESRVEELPGPAEEGGPRFRPVVRYAYEARGRRYESEQLEVGTSAAVARSDRGEAQRQVSRHPAGRDVDVWFDPRDPREAVLVRGVPRAQIAAAAVVGLALVGVGLFALAR
jgi:hypothetical protein